MGYRGVQSGWAVGAPCVVLEGLRGAVPDGRVLVPEETKHRPTGWRARGSSREFVLAGALRVRVPAGV